jgi:hypothetical protein
MTKSFGNSVKKQGKIPLQIKRENVPEESTDDDESPIESVSILNLIFLVSFDYYLRHLRREQV